MNKWLDRPPILPKMAETQEVCAIYFVNLLLKVGYVLLNYSNNN